MKKTNSHTESERRAAPAAVMPRHKRPKEGPRQPAKRTEEALRESEERTRLILDTAYDAFISIDARGRITDWNTQAEAVFGWPREEALGRRLSHTIIPPQLREAHERGLRHFLATGEGPVLNKRIEITALHRHGRQFPAELAVWVAGSGDSCTFNAFVHDVTERKRPEDALRESEERYRDLYDGAPVAYFAIGKDGRIAKANRRASELLGYSLDDLVGRPVLDLYSDTPLGKDKAKRVLERVRRGRETHDEEMEMCGGGSTNGAGRTGKWRRAPGARSGHSRFRSVMSSTMDRVSTG